jgi:hypothetical protein
MFTWVGDILDWILRENTIEKPSTFTLHLKGTHYAVLQQIQQQKQNHKVQSIIQTILLPKRTRFYLNQKSNLKFMRNQRSTNNFYFVIQTQLLSFFFNTWVYHWNVEIKLKIFKFPHAFLRIVLWSFEPAIHCPDGFEKK